jgi:UDP-glucose 4-epimerase
VSDHILVLGAGGFIGQQLVRALAQRDEKIIAVSRRPVDFGMACVESITGELNEPGQFTPLLAGSRAVVHLASRSTPGSSAGNAIAELEGNLRPTLALLQALQETPLTNLLYLSSGGSLYATEPNDLAAETANPRPRSYHGAGKMAAEHFISAWCSQYGGAATMLRPSNIYGPGQTERKGFGIVPTGLGKIIRGETLTVWGDGSAVRDYLYIDDFITLCTAILDKSMPTGVRVLNAASGIGVSLNDLFHVMESVTGQQLKRTYDASRVVDAARVVMDVTLANMHYDWMPSTPLYEGLRQTWEWFNTTPR